MIAKTPEPPYYSVIFTTESKTAADAAAQQDYADTAMRMVELAMAQEGFLGIETVYDAQGNEIAVSYWRDEASIQQWRKQAEHKLAQQRGREDWYQRYSVRVAQVQRAYQWARGE